MRDGFDCSELMDFAERLGAQSKEMLKAQKKMLRTSGTKTDISKSINHLLDDILGKKEEN